MRKIVVLEDKYYFYKGKSYKDDEVEELIPKLGKNIKIFILKETLLIRKFEIEKDKIKDFIKETIDKEIDMDGDLLIHNIYSRDKKSLYVYALRKGYEVSKISKNAKKICVIPIQFLINEKVKGRGDFYRNLVIITRVKDTVYLIIREDGRIIKSSFSDYLDFNLSDDYFDSINTKNIYIDKCLMNGLSKNIIEKYNIKSKEYIIKLNER